MKEKNRFWVGHHVSISGGAHLAPERAKALGATALGIFTKNQRQWAAPKLSKEECDLFKERLASAGYSPDQVLPHDSYLINLANPDDEKWQKSLDSFIHECERVEDLGLSLLNFHPGSHLSKISTEEAAKKIATALNESLSRCPKVIPVIETTAGSGGNLGRTFEEIALILDGVQAKERVGVCLDTCHLFAAGYDIRDREGYEEMMEKFERLIGLSHLKGIHLNDSKNDISTRKDRHESLGKGFMGKEIFELIAQDRRLEEIPIVLETPDETIWKEEIEWLQQIYAKTQSS